MNRETLVKIVGEHFVSELEGECAEFETLLEPYLSSPDDELEFYRASLQAEDCLIEVVYFLDPEEVDAHVDNDISNCDFSFCDYGVIFDYRDDPRGDDIHACPRSARNNWLRDEGK